MNTLLRPGRIVHDWFFEAVDARTYAAVRVSFSLAAFGIWLELWPLRHTLFSDTGMFGPSTPSSRFTFNVLALSNRTSVVDAVFVCALLSIACLALGVFTRAAAVGVYLWAVAYTTQTPVALAGYDTVFRATSFALMLSPASAVLSFRPHWFAGTTRALPRYGLRILQWQLLLIYWCTVWLKAPDQYWRRGEMVSYMLMSNFSRLPTPDAAHLGVLDPLLTWGTLLIEILVPILLWSRNTRLLGAFLGFLLHVGIAATTKLALFSLSMVPLYLAFFETQDWNRVNEWVRRCWPRKRQA